MSEYKALGWQLGAHQEIIMVISKKQTNKSKEKSVIFPYTRIIANKIFTPWYK